MKQDKPMCTCAVPTLGREKCPYHALPTDFRRHANRQVMDRYGRTVSVDVELSHDPEVCIMVRGDEFEAVPLTPADAHQLAAAIEFCATDAERYG